jgi:hypothetical protein
MKQYDFKLNCGDDIINGTKISVKADDEHAVRVKVVAVLGRAVRNLQVESLERVSRQAVEGIGGWEMTGEVRSERMKQWIF